MKPARLSLALIASLTFAATGAVAAPAESPRLPAEYLGLEATPVWFHLYSRPAFPENIGGQPDDARMGLGGGGTLRLMRVGLPGLYWTPLQLGLGGGTPQMTLFLHATTELGGRLPWFGGRVEVGAAFGAGAVVVSYAGGCDGDCYVGGLPVVLSPVVRVVLLDYGPVALGLFSRALVPLARPEDPARHFRGFATILMFGVDLALSRPAEERLP